MQKLFLMSLICLSSWSLRAQGVGEYLGDESVLYAETKQVNQFFRRFNGEEDSEGKRYYKGDKNYRDTQLRRQYLNMLFDGQNKEVSGSIKNEFIQQVTDKSKPAFLNFHGGEWFAEVNATFTYKGKDEKATLFLKLQEEKVGSKWILTKTYFKPFALLFHSDTTSQSSFLHPLSHELDFMNLRRVFQENKDQIDLYTERGYHPDYLSIFLYEIKNSSLKFKTISNVKFHFFQIDGWYFQLSRFNRSGYNRGWLISDLTKATSEEKKLLTKYIYFENE